MAKPKYTTEWMVILLKKYGSVHQIEKRTGIASETVAKYLKKAGIKYSTLPRVTPLQKQTIRNKYSEYRDKSELNVLAESLGLEYDTMKVHARRMGLTDKLNSGRVVKRRHATNGHPMTGKAQSPEARSKMGAASKKLWERPGSPMRTEESLQKRSDSGLRYMSSLTNPERHSRCKSGWYEHDGKLLFMRSSWELNYARYLDFLITHQEINKWEYEVDVFWFDKIKRGVRSYKPDFKVYGKDGLIVYHEVKGWDDAKSQTKAKRMALYYPDIVIKMIREKEYNQIKKLAPMIKGWGIWITKKPTP